MSTRIHVIFARGLPWVRAGYLFMQDNKLRLLEHRPSSDFSHTMSMVAAVTEPASVILAHSLSKPTALSVAFSTSENLTSSQASMRIDMSPILCGLV